jgi:hypothetical protein
VKTTSFYLQLTLYILLTFIIHLGILFLLDKPIFDNKIIESYLINIFTAFLLYYIIDRHKARFKDNIGFIFMLSSYIKFGLFFIFIYPYFDKNSTDLTIEFVTFFTPYSVCLIVETMALIKLLNKLEYKD